MVSPVCSDSACVAFQPPWESICRSLRYLCSQSSCWSLNSLPIIYCQLSYNMQNSLDMFLFKMHRKYCTCLNTHTHIHHTLALIVTLWNTKARVNDSVRGGGGEGNERGICQNLHLCSNKKTTKLLQLQKLTAAVIVGDFPPNEIIQHQIEVKNTLLLKTSKSDTKMMPINVLVLQENRLQGWGLSSPLARCTFAKPCTSGYSAAPAV